MWHCLFIHTQARNILAKLLVDPLVQQPFKEIHIGLCAIIRVLNSQNRCINLPLYQNLCTSTYLRICETFPWAVISPSIHRVLAHSWEKIEMNGLYGLGSESEEGLEAQNKFIRHLREHGARKTSTEDNFSDTWNHLWRKSCPVILELDREKRKRAPKIMVSNEIDTLVENLFAEENLS